MFTIQCENCLSTDVSAIPCDNDKVILNCENCESEQVIGVVFFE